MAVEFFSYGYDTAPGEGLSESVWHEMFPAIGQASYAVRSAADWKVTAVSGADRTVSIAAGRGLGKGVIDKTVANDTIQLDPITSGSRWDLIACRRDPTPTSGQSSFTKVSGGATPVIPGGRLAGPGIHDQPLALVQVTAGQTQPTAIIDLRTWVGDGGGLVAVSDLVRSYMNTPGTRIWIDGLDWIRRVGANDTPEWVLATPNFGGIPANTKQIVKTGNVSLNTTIYGDAYYSFDSPFPNALVSVVGNDATDPAFWPALIIKWAAVYSDRTRFCFRVYDQAGNIMASKTNINISFIATGY